MVIWIDPATVFKFQVNSQRPAPNNDIVVIARGLEGNDPDLFITLNKEITNVNDM